MSFGNAFGSSAFGGATSSASAQAGPDLQEIQSAELEFKGLNNEAKVRLLPTPWPDDKPPPPTSSLLSLAPQQGLLAAAGPDSIVIAKIGAVREAFSQKEGDGNIKPFQPQTTLQLGIRVSQVAFSSDGNCLLISAEQGGGIAAYDTQNLLQGQTQTAFELASNGQALKALVPNPAPESSQLFAAITESGKLLIADLKTRSWTYGQNGGGQENVSALAWSTRGKALLVGKIDGTVVQLKADGSVMTQAPIPRPPQLHGDKHVSAIAWMENDLALFVYTPSATGGMADPSDYFIWERTPKSTTYKFSKLPEVASGWGDRTPAQQFLARLRDFHNCNQIVLVANTASEDVGIVCRSTTPLADNAPVNIFTSVTQINDARRAQLPMKADFSASTSPIGMALDLSSTESVLMPIPGDEYDRSPGPLPGILLLNNDGVLAAWWLVYADAIRKGLTYPGLVEKTEAVSKPTFGQSATVGSAGQTSSFGQASAAGKSTPSAFGQPSTSSTFGAPSTLGSKPTFGQSSLTTPTFGQSAFGKPSAFGQPSQTQSSFGQPSFGSAGALGTKQPAFGSPSAMGNAAASPLSAPKNDSGQSSSGSAKPSGPIFGSSFGGNSSAASPFAQAAQSGPTKSPFSPVDEASKSSPSESTKSPFGTASKAPFGTPTSTASPFGNDGKSAFTPQAGTNLFGTPSPFGAPANPKSPFATGEPISSDRKGIFGSSSETKSLFAKPSMSSTPPPNPFGEPSAFAKSASQAAKSKLSEEKKDNASSFFGSAFGDSLNEAKVSEPVGNKEESMDDSNTKAPESPEITQSTTPKETPAALKTAPPTGASLFGTTSETPKAQERPTPTFSFTQSTPREQPRTAQASSDSPAPPESTSKATFTPTNSSASSVDTLPGSGSATTVASEARLPPDFTKKAEASLPPEFTKQPDAPLPPDFTKKSDKTDFAEKTDAPLPPDFTKAQSKEHTPSAKTTPSDAPLPPDFTKAEAPKPSEERKTPTKSDSMPQNQASPLPSFVKPTAEATEAPLPPDFLSQKPKDKAAKMEPPELPEDTSSLDDEGSGIDVGKELSIDNSPESSFGSKSSNVFVTKPSSKKPVSVFDSVHRANVPFFSMPPPTSEPESPRSPSPVRSGRGMAELKPPSSGMRSVSGPAVPKVGTRKPTQGRYQPPPQTFAKPVASFSHDQERDHKLEAKRQAQKAAEEQELSDQEDDYIRAELEAPIEATRTLAPFLAHTDYTGGVSKTGVPGQIEIVYRDANSMIDTLGLNARALASWVAGQSEHKDRNVDDLEEPEDWTLVEVKDIVDVERNVQAELETGAIGEKVAAQFTKLAHEMTTELNRLRRRNEEIARTVENLADASDDENDIVPLSTVASEAQRDLRRSLTDFRTNLTKAEESITVMKTQLATLDRTNSKVPTVEAVERTILKMTTMVERKSADLDILAAKARQLGVLDEQPEQQQRRFLAYHSPRRSRSGTPVGSSPAGSVYNTPQLRSSITGGTPSKLRSSVLAQQMNKLSLGIGSESNRAELGKRYMDTWKARQEVRIVLKDALGEGAPRIRPLEDD